MELTIQGLSKHLGVAPNTIERWIKQGKLPVSRTNSNYSFRVSDLEKWATRYNINLNLSDIRGDRQKPDAMISLSDAIQNGGVFFDIQGTDIKSVLESSLECVSAIPDDFKPDLLERLLERENTLSTGIGNGIAIPHPREALGYIKESMLCICVLKDPVDYNALDQKPVSILFISLCTSLKTHLHLLSLLSFCLKNAQFRSFLDARPEPGQLIEKVMELQDQNPF